MNSETTSSDRSHKKESVRNEKYNTDMKNTSDVINIRLNEAEDEIGNLEESCKKHLIRTIKGKNFFF